MNFRASPSDPKEDQKKLVKTLEDLLRLAKTGNIEGFILFAQYHDGSQGYAIQGINNFTIPTLCTMGDSVLRRLNDAWFNGEVQSSDELEPVLRDVTPGPGPGQDRKESKDNEETDA